MSSSIQEEKSTVEKRMSWWVEARFGMFIHWGLYAIPARGEWVMYCERIPKNEYARLAQKFNPKRFDADKWVELAKQAGARYMVLTTRHHDGFCLWDSSVSDFTSVKTAARRDFVAEYVEACRKAGMRIGFYYSLLDWRWPAYWDGPEKNPEGWKEFRNYVHAQVRELLTNYGKIDILWYDGGWPHSPDAWGSEQLNAMVRSLQPEIIINNRSGLPGDFDTPEQRIEVSHRPWEACM
ncbi:MAG: alpha-L-fucosidase, partial [Crenarchaeota archaeon]|nr:alpha-L-fucosidase [Thermoproteota archaeon]